MSLLDLQAEAENIVKNFIILEPKTPPLVLAEKILDEAEPEFSEELAHSLMVEFFVRRIRVERKNHSASQLKLPGYEHLPVWIRISKDERIRTLDANRTHLVKFCKFLGKGYQEKKKGDLKIAEAQELIKKMGKRKRATVGQILSLKPRHS
jgi:hypothetical protein